MKTEDAIKRLTESEQHDAVHHVVCVLVGRPATPQENDQRSGIPNIGLQQSVS
jgi:predicted metal-binding protein